jgi:hypothetical protein
LCSEFVLTFVTSGYLNYVLNTVIVTVCSFRFFGTKLSYGQSYRHVLSPVLFTRISRICLWFDFVHANCVVTCSWQREPDDIRLDYMSRQLWLLTCTNCICADMKWKLTEVHKQGFLLCAGYLQI